MSTNLQIVFFTVGILLLTLGVALVFPFLIDYSAGHGNAGAFGWSAVFALFAGGGLCLANRSFPKHMSIRQAFLLTNACWISISLFAAIPLYLSDIHISYTDAVFEVVSGLTTTGATVLSGLDSMSHGILMWRAITHFIGGIGIIAFALMLMPFLQIAGMQLFHSESSDKSDKLMPKTSDVVWSIILVYLALNLACILSYYALGMTFFDAVVHAFGTIATGGFSSHDKSFGFYDDSYALQMAGTLFMVLSGMPFILYVKAAYQGKFEFFKNSEVRVYIGVLSLAVIMLTVHLWLNGVYSLADSFKYTAFNLSSIMSSSGFASVDYSQWDSFAWSLFFFLTYVGCCSGSTAGGIKMLQINIAFKALARHIKTLIYPSGVFAVTYEGKPLENDVINSVMTFLFLYVFFNVVLTIALTLTGVDFITAITGVATCMANVGPGLGDIIGPAGNFGPLNDAAKWILSFGMLLGRLEVMTMLVIFMPSFWRD